MTETEYINATNLAKIRAVKSLLGDVHPFDNINEKEMRTMFLQLQLWESALARKVVVK